MNRAAVLLSWIGPNVAVAGLAGNIASSLEYYEHARGLVEEQSIIIIITCPDREFYYNNRQAAARELDVSTFFSSRWARAVCHT